MKATKQYKEVLSFEFVGEILKHDLIQIKVTEQYFAVVLFVMLYEVLITFTSVFKII